MYCPNCSAELRARTDAACWNCDAYVGLGAAWAPTEAPVGPFRKFTPKRTQPVEPVARKEQDYAEVSPIASVLLRCLVAVLIWIPLSILAVLSVIPYGGSSGFTTLAATSFWILFVWVLFPLTRYFQKKPFKAHDAG
jgi:hypothetical protein